MNRGIWQMDEKNTALAGGADIVALPEEVNRGFMRRLQSTFTAPTRVSKSRQPGSVEEIASCPKSRTKADELPASIRDAKYPTPFGTPPD